MNIVDNRLFVNLVPAVREWAGASLNKQGISGSFPPADRTACTGFAPAILTQALAHTIVTPAKLPRQSYHGNPWKRTQAIIAFYTLTHVTQA